MGMTGMLISIIFTMVLTCLVCCSGPGNTVKNLADVILNGKSLGIVWKTPFRIDISPALKKGKNELEIKVANLWVNRLIGDQQPDEAHRITYTTQQFYRVDSPVLPSGLMGPVKILRLSTSN